VGATKGRGSAAEASSATVNAGRSSTEILHRTVGQVLGQIDLVAVEHVPGVPSHRPFTEMVPMVSIPVNSNTVVDGSGSGGRWWC
jgi:hypothetical protein